MTYPSVRDRGGGRWPWRGQWPQAQAPPPQQPPPDAASGAEDPARPVRATVESSLTVSSCPCGQTTGALDSVIGREISKVAPQARHR